MTEAEVLDPGPGTVGLDTQYGHGPSGRRQRSSYLVQASATRARESWRTAPHRRLQYILLNDSALTALERADGNRGPEVWRLSGPLGDCNATVASLSAAFDQHLASACRVTADNRARGRNTGWRGAWS